MIAHVVGARPNLPKFAPVHRALTEAGVSQYVIHTGQHYDYALSDEFFQLLEIPAPDVNLAVGSHSHAVQTGRSMELLEPVLGDLRPNWVLVYGDVNSTVAAALTAAKLGIPVAHVEAGLRSFDWSMPEEINRLVTDTLSTLLFTHSPEADQQLLREGKSESDIARVGNSMIDSLVRALPAADAALALRTYGLASDPLVVTFHRPSNVDDPVRFEAVAAALREMAEERPVFFAAHPRTLERISRTGVNFGQVIVHGPVSYLDMLALMRAASVVVTDSGGVQEETTYLGVPCLTVRPNTERAITLRVGTNQLVPDPAMIPDAVRSALRPAAPPRIDGWDGRAGERIATELTLRT